MLLAPRLERLSPREVENVEARRKGQDAGLRACGAAGHREKSCVVRFSDAGLRRGLCGFAARAESAGSRQSPPRLQLYRYCEFEKSK